MNITNGKALAKTERGCTEIFFINLWINLKVNEIGTGNEAKKIIDGLIPRIEKE